MLLDSDKVRRVTVAFQPVDFMRLKKHLLDRGGVTVKAFAHAAIMEKLVYEETEDKNNRSV